MKGTLRVERLGKCEPRFEAQSLELSRRTALESGVDYLVESVINERMTSD